MTTNNNRGKLQRLLRDMFQFDCSELDFGIYRIMNYKRKAIEDFINKDLIEAVSSELDKGALAEQSQAAQKLKKLQKQIKETLGEEAIDAEGKLAEQFAKTKIGKEYLELQSEAIGAKNRSALEALIFNHLYAFFSRYYDSGDFMSKRRYSKKEKYAIPYNGEEVYLHWANSDQYYIKTDEYFRDYNFRSQGVTVHFKMQNADIEKDNVKGDKGFFIPKYSEISYDKKAKEIIIPFEHRPLTEQEEITYGGKNQQDKIINEATEEILKKLKDDKAQAALLAERRITSDGKSVSYLEHHLRQYTRRNTSDFFIHKNLKGFLEKELDFYLKNEVLNIDELRAAGKHLSHGWFQTMLVLKNIGHKIIVFLAQIENFQKKLFEKKKFVTETQYCIAVGHIPEKFYEQIAQNDVQWAEWKELFHINEEQKNLFNANAKSKEDKRIAFLKAHPTLVLDTKHFDTDFVNRLLASFEDIDLLCEGTVICSENFQGLRLLNEKYKDTVKCIYIDPPFNLGENADFLYKVNYKDSTWLSLLENRLRESSRLMQRDGSVFVRCNHDGNMLIRLMMDQIYSPKNFRNEIIVRRAEETKGDLNKQFGTIRSVTVNYDNIYWYSIDPDTRFGRFLKPTKGKQAKAHWHSFWKAEDRPNLRYEILGIDLTKHYGQWMWSKERAREAVENNKKYQKVTEKTGESLEDYWKRTGQSLEFVSRQGDGYSSIKYWIPPRDLVMADNNWLDIKGYANRWGFKTENSEVLLKRVIEGLTKRGETVLDFFIGSGTTAAVAHKLSRRWLAIEMGSHFWHVILPRLKAVLYGETSGISKQISWEGGGAFRYQCIESYEDALNNISFEDGQGQTQLMKFDDYLLNYMLEFETKGSDTFLNIEKLTTPFSYKLHITEGQETKEKVVDLPETFNYLLGLHVKTRKVYDDKGRKYLVYRGTVDHKEITVIWRETKGWEKKDLERDKKFVADNKLTEGADEVFVNGDSFIPQARALDTVFKARMFEVV